MVIIGALGIQVEPSLHIFVLPASQNEVPATPLEELTYRRSLRVALDILNERTSLSPESHPIEDGTTLSQKEKPDAEVASQVSSAPSLPFLGEDGQAVAAPCTPRRRWACSPKSLSPPSAFEEDLRYKVGPKTGLSENGARGAEVAAPTGEDDDSGSQLDHGQDSTTEKRQRNLEEKPTRRRRTESGLSRGESVTENEGQANSCVALASPRLPSQTWEGDPCAGVRGCDRVESSGNIGPLPAPERSRGRSTKRPRLDGGQKPPTRQLGTRTVGTAPSPRSCSGEVMMLRTAGDGDKPEEGNHGRGRLLWGPEVYHGMLFVCKRLSVPRSAHPPWGIVTFSPPRYFCLCV